MPNNTSRKTKVRGFLRSNRPDDVTKPSSCPIRSDSQTTGLSLPVADNWIDEDAYAFLIMYVAICWFILVNIVIINSVNKLFCPHFCDKLFSQFFVTHPANPLPPPLPRAPPSSHDGQYRPYTNMLTKKLYCAGPMSIFLFFSFICTTG